VRPQLLPQPGHTGALCADMTRGRSGVTRAMAGMNRQLSLPALQAILRDFERQNERMDMTSDVMGDAIDDAFEQEGEQEESEELVSQVCCCLSKSLPARVPHSCVPLRCRCLMKSVARLARSCWTRQRALRQPRSR